MPEPKSSMSLMDMDNKKASAPRTKEPVAKRPGRSRGRPRLDEVTKRDSELLERALDHFLEKGFEGTTISAITSSLGMAKRTVYARYGNKINLFKTALQKAIDDWMVPLEKLEELESDDLEATLIRVAQAIVTTMMSPAGLRLIRITNAESFRMPEIGAYITHRGRYQIVHFLSDLLRRRIPPEHCPDAPESDDLAITFLNIISLPARLNAWGIPPGEEDIDKLIRQRVKIFLRGALPR